MKASTSILASAMFLLVVVLATVAAADDKIPGDLVKVVNRIRAIVRGKGEEAIYETGEKHEVLYFEGAHTATDQVSEKEEQKNEVQPAAIDENFPQLKQEKPPTKKDVPLTTDQVHAATEAEGQKGEQKNEVQREAVVVPQGVEVAEEGATSTENGKSSNKIETPVRGGSEEEEEEVTSSEVDKKIPQRKQEKPLSKKDVPILREIEKARPGRNAAPLKGAAGTGTTRKTNVAPSGKVTQSSNRGVARRAVDGNTKGYWKGGSVTRTNREPNPFWRVQFRNPIDIAQIRVWNCQDPGCQDRIDGAIIEIMEPANGPALETRVIRSSTNSRPFTINFAPPGLHARDIKIHIPSNSEVLSLAEVEVFDNCVKVSGSSFCYKGTGRCTSSLGQVYDWVYVQIRRGCQEYTENSPSACAAYCLGLTYWEPKPTLRGFELNLDGTCFCLYEDFFWMSFAQGQCHSEYWGSNDGTGPISTSDGSYDDEECYALA